MTLKIDFTEIEFLPEFYRNQKTLLLKLNFPYQDLFIEFSLSKTLLLKLDFTSNLD
jgi:hypothetical protein